MPTRKDTRGRRTRGGLVVRLLAAMAAVALLAAAGGYWWLRQASLPTVAGTLVLPGLTERVVVEREPSGVVHIQAANDHDLIFAQGVVHAQDRLWQMEFQRRIGAGRLAEIFGPEALDRDRYLRTWGFLRAASAAYGNLGAEARGLVDAYAAGINAYLESRPPLPPELRLLGVTPEPWTGADVLVWAKMMAHNLAENRQAELGRYRLLARGLSSERIATLMPPYPGEQYPAENGLVGPGADLAARREAAERRSLGLSALDAANRDHLPQASNNWVVHGARTATGLPLLANDVHLGMQLPATWHLMHLKSPGFDVIGATLPGLPLVIIGRNRDIAWGVTNLAADVEDLYLLDERDGGYRYQGEIHPYRIREERIEVRDASPVTIRVRESLLGPVISDAAADAAAAPPVAVRWTGLDADDTSVEAFLGIDRARDWQEFSRAVGRFVAPGQNFVYADREGHIGYLASGRIPVRREGHSGLYPAAGDGSADWLGYLPASELPSRFDPPAGLIVTANHRITGPDYPHRLSYEWGADPYRARRIEELLLARGAHDGASMEAIQQDTLTLLHHDLRPVLAAIRPASSAARLWQGRLLAWDGDAAVGSRESSLFHAWYRALATLPSAETGTPYWDDYPGYLIRALTAGDSSCDQQETGCLGFAGRALEQALAALGGDLVREPPPWGDLHRAHLAHKMLTHTPLRFLSDRVLPFGGSRFTVNVGPYRQEDWVMYHGASYRQVIDLADPERSTFVIAGGQSGNWLSARYSDQLALWERGEYLPMRREGYAVADTLVLVPPPP